MYIYIHNVCVCVCVCVCVIMSNTKKSELAMKMIISRRARLYMPDRCVCFRGGGTGGGGILNISINICDIISAVTVVYRMV